MAELIKYAAAIQTAYNPTIWEWRKQEVDNDYMIVIIKDENGNTLNELEVEFVNNIASVNLTTIIKCLFTDEIIDIFTYPDVEENQIQNRFFYYKQLFGRYVIEGGLGNRLNLFVNSASQFGFTQGMTDYIGKFLTGFEKIIRYDGYEYRLSFLHSKGSDTYVVEDGVCFNFEDDNYNFKTDDYHITFDVIAQTVVDLANYPNDYYLRDNDGVIIKDADANPITLDDIPSTYKATSMQVDTRKAPAHPFYVRWINRLGGYDYWMFGCRQYITRSLSSQNTYASYFEDVQQSAGDTQVYGKEGKEQAEVSSGLLNPNQFEQVSRLIYSPRIEWYNEAASKWLTLLVDKSDNTMGTHQTMRECLFTFTLPTPQLQF